MARLELAAAVVSSFLAGLEDPDKRRAAYERLTQFMQCAPADGPAAAVVAEERMLSRDAAGEV